jgi:hypothetical protein
VSLSANITSPLRLNQNLDLKERAGLTINFTAANPPFNAAEGRTVTITNGTITFTATGGPNILYGLLPAIEVVGKPAIATTPSIQTSVTTDTDLASILGKITSKGDPARVLATSAFTELHQDFVVPANIALTLNSYASTFKNASSGIPANSEFNVIVNGSLTFRGDSVGNLYALEPTGNVVINNALDFAEVGGGASGSLIILKPGKTLTISDPSKVKGNGGFKATAIAVTGAIAPFTVGGDEYGIADAITPFEAKGFEAAIANIKAAKAMFLDDITLHSTAFSSISSASTTKVSGTVLITANTGSFDAVRDGDPTAASNPPFTLPSTTPAVTVDAPNTSAGFVATGGAGTLDKATFTLTGTGTLSIKDTGFTGSGTSVGVLKYTKPEFTCFNLTWTVDQFHIGVSTKRN